jgi:hypothetical protein
MSKAKRKRLEKEAAKKSSEVQETVSLWQGKRVIFIVSAVFIALIAIIIGVNHYFSPDQKYYRINVITVDDKSISMDYFVRRCFAAGSDPMNMLTGITQEMVIQKEAETAGLQVSDGMVEDKLIELAQGTSDSISQSEFKEWYRQRLNESHLTDKEYRQIVATQLLSETFYDVITESMSTVAEQVHLSIIVTDTEEEAEYVKSLWKDGADFAELAREYSIDASTSENGGDVGWVPRGVVYQSMLDTVAFEELDVGMVSDPLPYYDTSVESAQSPAYVDYFLVLVSEKAAAREIDEQYLDTVKASEFQDWLNQTISTHTIRYTGVNGGFDSETYSWINWQLQLMTSEKNDQQSE